MFLLCLYLTTIFVTIEHDVFSNRFMGLLRLEAYCFKSTVQSNILQEIRLKKALFELIKR